MPIAIIAVIVVAALGAGFFYFTNTTTVSDSPSATTEVATRPTDEREDTAPDVAVEPNTNNEEATDDDAVVAVEAGIDVASDTETEQTATYADGTYTASASYLTPRRTEHLVGVTLTIENDVVVDSVVTYDGAAGEYSNDNQARFDQAYSAEVIGQPLDAISLSRVGSASLTSGAFNEAKAKIATEARS